MKITRCIFLMAAAAAFSASASAQSQKVVTLDMAKTMAEEAMAQCRADGYKVTVLVVDSLNTPKALLRDDGATSATTEVAKMKATATMFYNAPSGPPQQPPPGTLAPPLPVP